MAQWFSIFWKTLKNSGWQIMNWWIFLCSGGVTLDKNPSDQTVRYVILDDRDLPSMKFMIEPHMEYHLLTWIVEWFNSVGTYGT